MITITPDRGKGATNRLMASSVSLKRKSAAPITPALADA